ncbi:MAG TPA: class I SAM-dependent methyltransferase [Pseudogracilibacillus sp.]|nr:class I SAM-dependent methyltransferase [Pseudogracilibacillus sp.]
MSLNDQELKNYIKKYNLQHREDVIDFIKQNPENLDVVGLSRIAELVNNSRVDTAAYYTDPATLAEIKKQLPKINKRTIRILEPSVGVGNFLQMIIDTYAYADKVIIDVNDIDEKSIAMTKLLNEYRHIPSNVEINYHVGDFLFPFFNDTYDLVIGNPPFLRLNKRTGLADYAITFNDDVTTNMSGFFLQKAIDISDYVVMIMPKYFLNNPDFQVSRERAKKRAIERIIDFGEKGFKGVLIETIAVFIHTTKEPHETVAHSVTKKLTNVQAQAALTSEEFPYWLLYRNTFFDEIAQKMTFGVFDVFRDRQLTNAILKEKGDIKVLKSRNIKRDGTGIIAIDGYDRYVDEKDVQQMQVMQYLDRDDVFLAPNMTYYPRVIRKPKGTLVNGSVAILENISAEEITDEHLAFLSSETFEAFYRIARNYSTRSLNIDKNSVYFFGLLHDK